METTIVQDFRIKTELERIIGANNDRRLGEQLMKCHSVRNADRDMWASAEPILSDVTIAVRKGIMPETVRGKHNKKVRWRLSLVPMPECMHE